MKPEMNKSLFGLDADSPPAFCGGLIEANPPLEKVVGDAAFPPAFCGGLIEAMNSSCLGVAYSYSPPLFAGASLKRTWLARTVRW